MDKNIRLFVRFAYIALPLQVQYVCGTLGISFFFVHLEIDIERRRSLETRLPKQGLDK